MRFKLRNDIPGRAGFYYVTWVDESGRGHRASARTRDLDAAQKFYARFVLEHDTPRDQRPDRVTMDAILVRYWHQHGRSRFAGDPIRQTIKHVADKLPKITVAEFDLNRQRQFRLALAEGGCGPASFARYRGVIVAALRRAVKYGELVSIPHPFEPLETAEQPGVEPFTLDELRALFKAAVTQNERTMLVVWTATCCRPAALVDLTWDRVDAKTQTIDFRVPGRRVVKKRRTVPPLAPTAALYLEGIRSVGPVVARRTKRLTRPWKGWKTTWRRLAVRAGVRETAYGIRKAVATWMRSKGVPESDVLGMLGHRYGGSETERYARPGHMASARDAVEELLREVAPPWLRVAPSARDAAEADFSALRAANDER